MAVETQLLAQIADGGTAQAGDKLVATRSGADVLVTLPTSMGGGATGATGPKGATGADSTVAGPRGATGPQGVTGPAGSGGTGGGGGGDVYRSSNVTALSDYQVPTWTNQSPGDSSGTGVGGYMRATPVTISEKGELYNNLKMVDTIDDQEDLVIGPTGSGTYIELDANGGSSTLRFSADIPVGWNARLVRTGDTDVTWAYNGPTGASGASGGSAPPYAGMTGVDGPYFNDPRIRSMLVGGNTPITHIKNKYGHVDVYVRATGGGMVWKCGGNRNGYCWLPDKNGVYFTSYSGSMWYDVDRPGGGRDERQSGILYPSNVSVVESTYSPEIEAQGSSANGGIVFGPSALIAGGTYILTVSDRYARVNIFEVDYGLVQDETILAGVTWPGGMSNIIKIDDHNFLLVGAKAKPVSYTPPGGATWVATEGFYVFNDDSWTVSRLGASSLHGWNASASCWGSGSKILLSHEATNALYTLDPFTGVINVSGAGTLPRVVGMATSADGDVYITTADDQIWRYSGVSDTVELIHTSQSALMLPAETENSSTTSRNIVYVEGINSLFVLVDDNHGIDAAILIDISNNYEVTKVKRPSWSVPASDSRFRKYISGYSTSLPPAGNVAITAGQYAVYVSPGATTNYDYEPGYLWDARTRSAKIMDFSVNKEIVILPGLDAI